LFWCISNFSKSSRNDNQIIFLSGHGGDEIFSDYGNEGNRKSSILDLDYTNVRSKWPNFDSAYGRNIIQMFERVAGCFGIESRYPFLDKQVVQEFLWLSDTLKIVNLNNVFLNI
jgi:asparagine synthetase B (glutamine-hydrolysing)